jgi:hypothetical protein
LTVRKMKELPDHVGEFIDLAKQYVREQTVEPAKALGRLAGFGFAAGVLFTLAALFLAVAGMRMIVDVMPDGTIWSGLGYVAAAVAVFIVIGLVIGLVSQRTSK